MSAAVAVKQAPPSPRRIDSWQRHRAWSKHQRLYGELRRECIGAAELERDGLRAFPLFVAGAPAFVARTATYLLAFLAGHYVNARRLGYTGGWAKLAHVFRSSGFHMCSARSLERAAAELVGCGLLMIVPMFETAAEREARGAHAYFVDRLGRLRLDRETHALLCLTPEAGELVGKSVGARRRRRLPLLASSRWRSVRSSLPRRGREGGLHTPEKRPVDSVDKCHSATENRREGASPSAPRELPPAAGRLPGAPPQRLRSVPPAALPEGKEGKALTPAAPPAGGAVALPPPKTPPSATQSDWRRNYEALLAAEFERLRGRR